MSYAAPYEQHVIEYEPAAPAQELIFVPRSRRQWLPFLLPLLLTGVSYVGGGLPELTDLGFVMFFLLCAYYLVSEFFYFPQRFGIGGLVLYGGTLAWYCQDYFTHWFRANFNDPATPVHSWVIAKEAFLLVTFTIGMCLGLGIKRGKWLEKVILAVPEPGTEMFYFVLVLAVFFFGISSFIFWTNEFFLYVMYKAAVGLPYEFTVWRTGALNTNWGGYVAQILQVGSAGGVMAALYAIMFNRSWIRRILCLMIWAFWAALAYQSDRRGEIAFMLFPPIALLFIKYQAQAAAMFKRHSIRAYVLCGILSFGMLVVVQLQGTFRGVGLDKATLVGLDITKNQGNTMFSEGLLAYEKIPAEHDFFRNTWPLEGMIRAVPDQAFWFVISVIPRALWNDKPVDALWEWYNRVFNGTDNGRVGTTISHGLVGCWYFNYGFWGVVEGGLLVGWMMGSSERALQNSNGRPMGILFSLAFATWLFRLYRDFIFIDVHGLLLAGILLSILVYVFRPFMRGSAEQQNFSQ